MSEFFVCQRCKQRVSVDAGLLRIDAALFRRGERSLSALHKGAVSASLPPLPQPPPPPLSQSPTLSQPPSAASVSAGGHRSLIQSYRGGWRPSEPQPTPQPPAKAAANAQAAAAMAAMVFAGSSYLPLLNATPAEASAASAAVGAAPSASPQLSASVGVSVPIPAGLAAAMASSSQAQLSKSAMRRSHRGMRSTVAIGSSAASAQQQQQQQQQQQFGSSGQLPSVISPGRSPLSSTVAGVSSSTTPPPQQQQAVVVDDAAAMAEAEELFTAATEASMLDHPLCADCAMAELFKASELLRKTRTEIRGYQMADEEVSQMLRAESIEQLDRDTAELQTEEQRLMTRLAQVAAAKSRVLRDTELCAQRQGALRELELRYWDRYNAHHRRAVEFEEDARGVRVALAVGRRRLAALCRSNVLNDSFRIWHDGHFGTINSLRLGRLASVPVDWAENNAGWGFATLLLSTLCKIVRFESPTFSLLPLGSASCLIKKDGGSVHELSGDSGRLFSGRRFDASMAAFLTVLRELAEYCHKVDSTFTLPYLVDRGDRIGGLSVRMQFNDDHVWTRALKFLLTDLKWIVAWVSTRARR